MQTTVHNPFPQLSRVAIAPFFNLSNESTLDGRQVAIAYYNELQLIPGFEVVPVGTVEMAIRDHQLSMNGPEDVRKLAQLLNVDAVAVGMITDYSPYYPPRMALRVEWYSANPSFHPIPPGYGLPWGTQEERDIPQSLVQAAEFALAKEQLKTQTPAVPKSEDKPDEHGAKPASWTAGESAAGKASPSGSTGSSAKSGSARATGTGEVPPWPDPRGFVPPPPAGKPPSCWPSDAPVLVHTRNYNGHDADFTAALESYYVFRDDARFDGWQGYLQRSDDFIRFCCHMHIYEMLTARGGADEARVVWKWPTIR